MTAEMELAQFVVDTQFEQIPVAAQEVALRILQTTLGTAIAGSGEDGVREALAVYRSPPGTHSATVLVHGDVLPAASAACINGVMCRALDYCDAMAPGLHIGSSLVPAALATAEAVGGVSGRDFLVALVVGAEVAARMNLTEAGYAGLDPTGIAAVFGATAASARLLRLDTHQTLHALALAFNRAAGSFQSNIDGSLAVRMIQGWVAADGLNCARLAQAGLTGPHRFISGVYGFGALYAHSQSFEEEVRLELGKIYRLMQTMFKKYPSCGLSQGVTELALRMVAAGLDPADVQSATVTLPPYAHRLVGHEFVIGGNPRVNAQFSAQYCVANALTRKSSMLDHFKPESVCDTDIAELVKRIEVVADPVLDARGHTAVDLVIKCRDGRVLRESLDTAPGFPGQSLSDDEHTNRFRACLIYAGRDPVSGDKLLAAIRDLVNLPDIRAIIPLVSAGSAVA